MKHILHRPDLKAGGLLCVWLILSLTLTACEPSANQSSSKPTSPAALQTIRIYASLPLGGRSSSQGQNLINSMQLALEETSQKNSVVGNFKIDFVPLDNTAQPNDPTGVGQEIANARRAASDPDAMLYLGPLSTQAAEASIPILNAVNMPMISPGTTYPGLTKTIPGITQPDEPAKYYPDGTRNFFRLLPTDELQGRADASYTHAKLQSKTAFVVDDGSDYGVGLAKSYQQAAGQYEVQVVGQASLKGASADYNAVIDQIKKTNPATVFYSGGSATASKVVNGLHTAGVKAHFLAGGGIQDSSFLKETGNAGERVYSSISGADSSGLSANGETFLKNYRTRYGDTLESNTIYGYDAMKTALGAIQLAGKKDRMAILNTIAGLKNFTGAAGTWSFDANGDTSLSVFSFFIDRGQKWVFDSVTDASDHPTTPVSSGGAPGLVASKTTPVPGATPATPGKRVDAASQLPPAFQLYRLAELPVTVYLPPQNDNNKNRPLQVLVALHGMFNNGGNFGGNLLTFAQLHNLVLIAPTFNYNVNFKDPHVVTGEDLDLTHRLDAMPGQLADLTHLNFSPKVMVIGFSRGAQLAHHFAMLYPTRIQAIAIMSGGAYTLPETSFDNQLLPFPFGVGNLEEVTGHSFDQTDFVKIPFDVQVGALDNDPTQVSRDYDRYIGNNRVVRGENFYQALLQDGVKARFEVIPNTSHQVNPPQVQTAENFLREYVGD